MFRATSLLTLILVAVSSIGCAPQDTTDGTTGDATPAVIGPDASVPDGANNEVPATWVFRPDRTDRVYTVGSDSTSDVFFVNMTPGWHVTSGPAGIYYHPDALGSGEYSVSADIHLFDPGDRREAFGVFLGGTNLENDEIAYTYFLIRQGGQFLIKRRTGATTSVVRDWEANSAILSHAGEPGETALNKLSVAVGSDSVTFSVNGVSVATVPVGDVDTDGLAGFRVNHGLNLHISDFSVSDAAVQD